MNTRDHIKSAQAMVADDKGLLPMDDGTPVCDKRFVALDIPQTVDARCDWRPLIVTTPGLAKSIGGVIVCGEASEHSSDWIHLYPPPIFAIGSLK